MRPARTGQPRRLPPAGIALGGLAAALLVGAAGLLVSAGGRPWLVRAVTSGFFLKHAAVAAGAAVALAVLAALLIQAGRRNRRRDRSEEGAAILEFALALPFALMLTLIMVQSSLMMGGNLCVHYAAFCGARSAVVHVPTTLAGEPRNVVIDPSGSAKLLRIRDAAVWAVMPISCGGEQVGSADVDELVEGIDRLYNAYGRRTPGWVYTKLARKMQYAEDHTKVTLADPAAGAGAAYGPHEDLVVTVEHTLYLSVPYANRLFAAMDDGVELGFGAAEYGVRVTASCRLPNEGGQDYVDVERFEGS